MKRIVVSAFIAVLTMVCIEGWAQEKRHMVLFYNVENLFDTINDPNVKDEEFTPEGPKRWNSAKYRKKMNNLEKVFYTVSAENKVYPAVIGVSEIENRNVLEDIVSQPKLLNANYQIVHYDGPDARGVDVAFFYRPDVFKYEGSYPIKTVIPDMPDFRTRDILTMWGTIDDEPFYFMVAHWPSRLGGQAASNPRREAAARIMKEAADSVLRQNPNTKIVMMGDFNDDPTDPSMDQVLNAKMTVDELQAGDLFNPMRQLFNDGYGTLAYQDAWNLFDNIVVSENLINSEPGSLKLEKTSKKYYGNIYDRPFLKQTSGQYKGYPLRTFVGNNFQGGYSDHLPVYIFISK